VAARDAPVRSRVSTGDAPTVSICSGHGRIDAAEIERFRALKAEVEKGFASGQRSTATSRWAGDQPFGWSLQTWSKCKGRARGSQRP